MKNFCRTAVLVATLATLAGCFQQALLIELNPDGSGLIRVRSLLNRDSGMFGATTARPTIAEVDRLRFADLAHEFGEGVSFVEAKIVNGSKSWSGVEVVYAFDNIETVTIPLAFDRFASVQKDDKAEAANSDGSQPTKEKPSAESRATFHFTFSDTPNGDREVTVQTVIPEPDVASGGDAFADAGLDTPARSSSSLGSALALQLMKPALADARVSVLMDVRGEITTSSAPKQPTDHSVFLLDFRVGEFAKSDHFKAATAETQSFDELLKTEASWLDVIAPDAPATITYRANE